jgi:exodeoxyribonuclease VII small subunit
MTTLAATDDPASDYETSVARLEAIVARLDSGDAGLREVLELCAEGKRHIAFCAAELGAVATGLQELRLDDLVAGLETPGAPDAPAP